MSDCLFCAIASGGIPADVVASTDRVVAFRDIQPQAPVHVLIIPRAHHDDVPSIADVDPTLVAEMFALAAQVARAEGIDATGSRLVTNTGADGGPTVPHAHVHLLGGRRRSWPPG